MSCKIVGSSDANIKNPIVNDFSKIINNTKIAISPSGIFTTGLKVFALYTRLCLFQIGIYKHIYYPLLVPQMFIFTTKTYTCLYD